MPGQVANATLTTYDSAGNAVETQRVTGASVDPTSGALSYTGVLSASYASYNLAGQPVTQTGPDGQTTTNVYNGNGELSDSYDPLGDHTQTIFDADGRVQDTITRWVLKPDSPMTPPAILRRPRTM